MHRACLGCPNALAGASYEGATAYGTPFAVSTWQDCCAACQLFASCAAWVHITPTAAAGGSQMCYFRTSVTRLNPSDPAGGRAITGLMTSRTPPPPSAPPPMLNMSVPPPHQLPIPRCVVGVRAMRLRFSSCHTLLRTSDFLSVPVSPTDPVMLSELTELRG